MRKLAVCCSSFFQFQNFPGNFSLACNSQAYKFPGGLTARVTPVPIPNTEVKPCRADDTARVTARERRSPPGLEFKGRNPQSVRGLFYFCASLSFSYPVLNKISRSEKTLDRILRGTSDANISFSAMGRLLSRLGFVERVRGSHHIFTRTGVEEILNLQPKGSKCKPYQVR